MPPSYTQANRPMALATTLGPDKLLLVNFSGQEGISQLYSFTLDAIALNDTPIPFEQLLGQPIAVRLDLPKSKEKRFFCGICCRVAQGESGAVFTSYRLEMVPALWLLTRKAQSRIFQYETVKQILEKVLKVPGMKVDLSGLKGQYEPRDFCVQYRETDFNFASRLMEEEGIYYFFRHTPSGHEMVLADSPAAHVELPYQSTLTYKNLLQDAAQEEDILYDLGKSQLLTSGKVTLWDHCFEVPHKHLEAEKTIQASALVGQVTHKLAVGNNQALEIYDWPGEYAQRYDGVNRGGGDQPAEISKIFQDNTRTTAIRMEQEAATALTVEGAGNVRHMTPGFKIQIRNEPTDSTVKPLKAEGKFVIVSVIHHASIGDAYRSASESGFDYHNRFRLLPDGLPFRPPRVTPKPVVAGSQTAVVVGPKGEEIFTDKYGRIKVQFHWDREGQNDENSSCWVRVGTPWAGKQWGMIHIPRIGQEVIVDFLEGDPDQPIVVGSVYNAEMMPPYKLPDNRTQSGIKTRSSLQGSPDNFNEIRFEDKKGQEQLFIHAEKNQDIEVENDETHWVGHDRTKTIDHDETTHVKHDRTETVDNNETITIGVNRTEQVGSNETITIGANRTETVGGNESITISQNRTATVMMNEVATVLLTRTHTVGVNEAVTVGGAQEITVGGARMVTVGGVQVVTVGGNMNLSVGASLNIQAKDQIVLETGSAKIALKSDGKILIEGSDIVLKASGKITAQADGDMVLKASKIGQN